MDWSRSCHEIIKTLTSGILGVLCLAGLATASPLCPGDCNLDRQVNVDEVVTAVNIALGYADPGACWGADVDEDGEITIVDLLTSVVTINSVCGPVPEYRFQVSEQIDLSHSTGPHLGFSIGTVEEFGCSGYRIDGALQAQGGTIDVTLGGVVPPSGVCATVIAPAGFGTQLDMLEGEYVLKIHSRSRTDVYRLTISAELIALNPLDVSFSEPWYLRRHRVPHDVIRVECYRVHWGDENPAERIDELCPRLFTEVESIADPAPNVNGSVPGLHCGRSDFASGTCRLYHYTGNREALEAVFGASNNYDLPHGYRDTKGRGLYYKHIASWLGFRL